MDNSLHDLSKSTVSGVAQDLDASTALALQQDVANAYKWRSNARRNLGYFKGALADMRLAEQLAFDPKKKAIACNVHTLSLHLSHSGQPNLTKH